MPEPLRNSTNPQPPPACAVTCYNLADMSKHTRTTRTRSVASLPEDMTNMPEAPEQSTTTEVIEPPAKSGRKRRAGGLLDGEPAQLPPDSSPTGVPASMLNLEQLTSVLESLLFVAGRPLQESELRRLLLIDEKRLRDAITALAIACEKSGRGLRVQRTNDQVQFVSAPENARFVAALLGMPSQAKLTTPALETLAVVAYRQPITRSQIEFIRGVNSDRALASLLQYGLVIEIGRAATVGRPALFGTTADFLQQFGLASLEALPTPEFAEAEAIMAQHNAATQRIREAVSAADESVESVNEHE